MLIYLFIDTIISDQFGPFKTRTIFKKDNRRRLNGCVFDNPQSMMHTFHKPYIFFT